LAVIVSAIRGGFGPGVLATVLGAFGGLYFSPPGHRFTIAPGYAQTTTFQIALFLIAGGAMSWLGSELRKTRWQAEERARQREEMIESISSGFAAFDSTGRCLYGNRSAQRLTGWPSARLADELSLSNKLREVLKKGMALNFEMFCEPTNRWLEFHAYPAGGGGLTLFFEDISETKTAERGLQAALTGGDSRYPKECTLSGLLHICANCKKIRESDGKWRQIESYISEHSSAEFSHGLCPTCAEELYPGIIKH
jgi:PAS domain-containing protein